MIESFMQQVASGRMSDQLYRLALGIAVPKALMQAMHANSGRMRALVVGGGVRDAVLGYEPKDIDLEVYGTSYQDLAAVPTTASESTRADGRSRRGFFLKR